MRANAKIQFIKNQFAKLPSYEQKLILIALILIGVMILKNLIEPLLYIHKTKTIEHLIRHQDFIDIPQASPIKKSLKILKIEPKQIDQVYTVPGYVETNAKKDIEITTPIPGRIIRIPIKLGDWVQKNQILAEKLQ